jgi:hydrogenase maturation protease
VNGVVVIGVGNVLRGDDGAGLIAAERIGERVPEGVRVVLCEQEPSRLIDAWQGAWAAAIVDAVSSGAEPGALHRFDASAEPVPAQTFRSSTHAFGVGEAIELARALGRLPNRVVVYGVEGVEFQPGADLTPAVDAALRDVVEAVVEDVQRLIREEERCTNEH